MTNENQVQVVEEQGSVQAPNFNRGTIELIKRTIFKGATDDELALFCHKCVSSGCHPLDGKIHPSKFKDKDGSYRVVFISSIDYFRSSAEETGMYDGQDEPEFIWENDESTDSHPIECKVKIYKKGISRPFVGTATWKEFYPAIKNKQFMYDKMPKVMLAKCAESQGFRKAFPDKLNKLYSEEEMYQAMGQTDAPGNSTKPKITQKTTVVIDESLPTNSEDITDEMRSANKWISVKQVGLIHGKCKESGMDVEKLKLYLKDKKGIACLHHISWVNDQFKKLLTFIADASKVSIVNSYNNTADQPQKEVPGAFDHEEFKNAVIGTGAQAGINESAINDIINAELSFVNLDAVPADKQSVVIDLIMSEVESKANK